MSQVGTILIPVDFSDRSRAAARRACDFALASDATVHLMHATGAKEQDDVPAGAVVANGSVGRPEAQALARLADELGDRGARMVVSLEEEEEPAAMIRRAAALERADLVIVGGHGFEGGTHRIFRGSVSEQTIATCPAPLMVVKESELSAGDPIRRILLATDFSPASQAALDLATDWARRLDADVEVFHAMADVRPDYAQQSRVTAATINLAQRREQALERLQLMLARLAGLGIRAGADLTYGPASIEIVKRAQRGRAQLVVMGRSGRSAGGVGGSDRFGRVSEQVLKHVKCSVLFTGTRWVEV